MGNPRLSEVPADTQVEKVIGNWIYGLKFRIEVAATDITWGLSAYA